MKLLSLTIEGFRGIRHAKIVFGDHNVLVGPNGSGKSTIVDALSLVFGRTRMVRDLTEHDFCGSCPEATSRIRIVATLGGFAGNDPDRHDSWFREGRAVEKWWNPRTAEADAEPGPAVDQLCAQVAFAARFDLEELVVDQVRYFVDDGTAGDVFQDDTVQQIPPRLFDEIGYYVLPAHRTWEAAASFGSELFRKAVATLGGIPAQNVLDERNRLRYPTAPLEGDAGLLPLVERINAQLAQLMPRSPQLQLRVTSTDSESLLRALVPHYSVEHDVALPVGRHGTGLLSLQTFILLLEVGRERVRQGRPFLLAMEEPELHVPPGLQRRLIAQAVSIAGQTICTSHSPRVAAFYPPAAVQVLEHRGDQLASSPLLDAPLAGNASSAARKLYHEDRARVLEALMHHRVLLPEGRSEYEWFRLLADVLERGDRALAAPPSESPPFGAVVGVVPTHDSAVTETYERLRRLRAGIVPLVDGDAEGDEKIRQLQRMSLPPEVIIQWPVGWTVEDVVGWVLKGDLAVVPELKARVECKFADIDALVALFKIKTGSRRLKTDYLAYENVAAVVGDHEACLARAKALLEALALASMGRYGDSPVIKRENARSTDKCLVVRLVA